MVGRSNVGKSSLINALVKQKMARTSAAPGKTRLVNYYQLDTGLRAPGSRPQNMYLVDLPGYGYARGGPESALMFEQLTREYFDIERDRVIAGVLHLMDGRHPDLPQDAAAFEWLMRTQIPGAIVASKMDKLSRSDQITVVDTLARKYGVEVIPVSTVSGSGLDEVWKLLRRWQAEAKSQKREAGSR